MGIFRGKIFQGEVWGVEILRVGVFRIPFKGAESYFCVRHKNRRKYNHHLTTDVFPKNLQFFKSNQVSTYRKLNLPFTTCRNAKKSRTDQSIPIVSLLCLKRDDPQTFKSGGCKNIFSSVWAIGTTCFD